MFVQTFQPTGAKKYLFPPNIEAWEKLYKYTGCLSVFFFVCFLILYLYILYLYILFLYIYMLYFIFVFYIKLIVISLLFSRFKYQ